MAYPYPTKADVEQAATDSQNQQTTYKEFIEAQWANIPELTDKFTVEVIPAAYIVVVSKPAEVEQTEFNTLMEKYSIPNADVVVP